jgi:hypothetical protein
LLGVPLRLETWYVINYTHDFPSISFQPFLYLYFPRPVNYTTETPQGTIVGPQTSNALKKAFTVATEGIDYDAALAPNVLPGGTDAKSKKAMVDVLNAMAQKCPDSVIVTGGYSQGAAVNHRAIESLSSAVQEQIAGVILYGDTQKQQVFSLPAMCSRSDANARKGQ